MTIPFILLSLSLFFFIPLEGVNLTFEGDDKPVTASAYYVTRINQLARDIITVARSIVICYHTAAFPGKRVVNKRLQTSIISMLAPVIF